MADIKNKISGDLPPQLAGLGEIASNLWWSWQPAARILFERLDRQAWKEYGHNPIKMLNDLPREVLQSAAKDPHYLHHYQAVLTRFKQEMETKEGWFTENIKDPGSLPIACFSAEYGLHHCLPFYAGGLGFLAGDRLKECNDLAVPLVAVGFMYPEGYLRQRIHEDGWQENLDEVLDRDAAPITRVLSDEGEQSWVKIMKEAMKGTGPRFCSRRMVKEYATKFYQNALRSAMM